MRFPFNGLVSLGLVALLSLASYGEAQIARLDLETVESPAFGGQRFGDIGQYEWLRGIAYGQVDPTDSRHAGIVNLDRAPRTPSGHVAYRATVEIYRPIEMDRWNRGIYHTVANRGRAGAAEPAILERGFALVRVGWQGDLEATDDNIIAYLPVAHEVDGQPIIGPALEEFIFDDDAHIVRGVLTYPAASQDSGNGLLSVRATQDAKREAPVEMHWRYLNDTEIEITRPDDFDAGAIYEFIYQATDPIVLGLGFAAMRDTMSFLRHDTTDAAGNPNPLATVRAPQTAISIGISQSGRMLRDFLYQGFNEDLSGRPVFDGMHPNIAGSRKTFTNYQFGQPGRWQKQHEDHVYPGDQFPFTYQTLTDPISGRTDGLLQRCTASNTCPKIIHSDGEAELWQARASLIVTDPRGGHIELPENVRAYLIAGTQHGGGAGVHASSSRRGICQNLPNPMPLAQVRLALSLALYDWVTADLAPPHSRFPTVADGELVPTRANGFPDIPGVPYTASYNPLRASDHRSLPPMRGAAYTVLVGRTDADGNMLDGIRHPNLVAPVGTYTGWNLRREGFARGDQCGGTGSYIPFAKTAAARRSSGDPRLSLEERYPEPDVYVDAIRTAAEAAVRERLLLPRHAAEIVDRARQFMTLPAR